MRAAQTWHTESWPITFAHSVSALLMASLLECQVPRESGRTTDRARGSWGLQGKGGHRWRGGFGLRWQEERE